jgi:hypothetical protein
MPLSQEKRIMTPKYVLQKFVEAFNNADPDSLANLYSDDTVNHQVAAGDPIKGREAIRKMFTDGFAAANMTCIVENMFKDGKWAIMEWRDPLGLRGCVFFRIVDSKIVFQRGCWDRLTFCRQQNFPIPKERT